MSSTETPNVHRDRLESMTDAADRLAAALLAFNVVDRAWYSCDNARIAGETGEALTGYSQLRALFEAALDDVAVHARVLDGSPWTGEGLNLAWLDSNEPIRYYLAHPEYAETFQR